MIPIALAIAASTAAGVAAERRWGGRAQDATHRALIASLYTVIPFVVFFNLARLEVTVDVGGGIGLAYVAVGASVLAAWALSRFVLRLDQPATGAVICCVLVANTGYLGYPMAAALLGFDSLSEAVAYDTLVSAPSLLIAGFATGAAFGTRAGEGVRQRTAAFFTRNPALIAAAAALVVPDSLAPDVLVDASRIAVIAILPLGFFAVGVALASEAEEGALRIPPPLTSPVATVVTLRLLVAPALLYLLALPLIDLPDPYLLLAAMPCGINTVVVAHAYGLDLRITAEAVIWSTALVVIAGLGSLVV